MNEAGLLELEFAARVLEPLWQAGSYHSPASTCTSSSHGPLNIFHNHNLSDDYVQLGSAGGNTCEMNGPSLKQMPRARQKTKFDYNNDHLRLLDLLRGSIICKTFDDVLAVFRRLHKLEVDGILKIVRVKNRFKDGSLDGSGYCDANINIELLPCDSANTFKHGHICEIQIHLQSFYELKCGSHAIYKIVRTLQLEGALLEIPDVTAISTVTRCACSVLLMLAIFIGLLSSTFYRYYNWTGEAPWCTKAGELLPNVHTAALIFPFLLISYMSAARLLRALHSRQRLLATLLQLLCAVFVVAFGITLEGTVLVHMIPLPDPTKWSLIEGSTSFWSPHMGSLNYASSVFNIEQAYLKPAAKQEELHIVMFPYLLIGGLFARDFISDLLRKEPRTRKLSRIVLFYDRLFGINGKFFEYRVMAQQFLTVLLQSTIKLPQLGAVVWAAEATRSKAIQLENVASVAELVFNVVLFALVINAVYPAVLLQSKNSSLKRDGSMFLDAVLDSIYCLAVQMLLHFTVGSSAAPHAFFLYASNLVPAFHICAVACAIEFSAMHRNVAGIGSRHHTMFARLAADKISKRTVSLKQSVVFTVTTLGIVSLAVVFGCHDRFPMKSHVVGACRPCLCVNGTLVSCDVAAALFPNELFMADKNINEISTGSFDSHGFDDTTFVDFGYNRMQVLQSLPVAVEVVQLHHNMLSGSSGLFDCLSDKVELAYLEMDYNLLGDVGSIAIGDALEGKLNLYYLSLRGNDIMDAGFISIARALEDKQLLEHLALAENSIVSVEAAAALTNAMRKKQHLAHINLERLGNVAVEELTEMIANAKQLSILFYGSSHYGSVGAQGIAKALRDKKDLSLLYLGNSQIGDAGAQALSAALHDKPRLSIVNLGGNAMHDAALLDLAGVLVEEAPELQLVDVSSNPISNETEKLLLDILSAVPRVHVVGFISSGCPSLCPAGGLLRYPNHTYTDGSLCWEREDFCASGDCGSCATKQFNSLNSDCCGERTHRCELVCPTGMVFNADGTMVLPGFGAEFNCNDAVHHASNGVLPPMQCSEITAWLGSYTDCCV